MKFQKKISDFQSLDLCDGFAKVTPTQDADEERTEHKQQLNGELGLR